MNKLLVSLREKLQRGFKEQDRTSTACNLRKLK